MAAFRFKYDKKETINKTVRFPIDLVKRIEDEVLFGTESTFSNFVIQACEFALENLEKDEKKEKTHS